MDLNKAISDRARTIKPSGIRKFFDLASQMEGVVSLGVGEPDFTTPWKIREAAIYSIEKGKTFYTANRGLIELREEISKYYNNKFNAYYNPNSEVIVTVGGSEGIDIAVRALLNPGEEMIILDPGYVAYEPSVILSGGQSVRIHLEEKDEFKLTPEKLKAAITPNTKLMLINFPSNPTGGFMTREDYKKLVPIIKESGIIVISDEIYAELSYEHEFCSLASFPEIKDQVIVVSGFSKAFAMTGWRLGYLLSNSILSSAMVKIHQYIMMSAPTAAQYGALEGLKYCDDEVEEMRNAYMARRNYLVKEFNDMGLHTFKPQGAFYVFPSIESTGLTSERFCEALLNDQKVACVPGNAFGDSGEGFIRVSYAYSLEELKIAVEKIKIFLDKLKNKDI
ncbi:MAG: aminotransferase class I/II-fold pyridoxal phosphate-dependent enzyme [Eggerthia catenaformis]|uniref:aminotransferase class I/II-fold pyridoxal phosphate-dependent enzyme n=1 Tax=Eggerthia catenaformis TaxID=31973 RepID=UPI000478A761|nr:aminotransferase class I/II-fold pyridoxal phosphate-dependent enzyme [Eggerthia catenaformis]